jgi:hypothetical protein
MVKMEKARWLLTQVEELECKKKKSDRTDSVGSMSGSVTGRWGRAVHALIGRLSDSRATPEKGIDFTTLNMPPISFLGVVTKAGFMNKTATVTVSRWVIDTKTGKVRSSPPLKIINCLHQTLPCQI